MERLVATFATPPEARYAGTLTDLLTDLDGHPPATRPLFAERTWTPEDHTDVVRLHVAGSAAAAAATATAAAHGLTPLGPPAPLHDVPPPLWNAGVGGPSFALTSDRLHRAAEPVRRSLTATRATTDDRLEPTRVALRLLVAHGAATLADSTQRDVPGRDLPDLLALRLLSYRSHYEAVRARARRPEQLDDACDALYAQVGAVARDAVVAAAHGDGPRTEPAATWFDVVAGGHADLAVLFAKDALTSTARTLEDLEREQGRTLEPTRFHTPPSPALRALMHESPDFLAFRLATSLLYATLHGAGYALAERFVLCALVARANEDVSGRSTEDLRDDLDLLAHELVGAPPTRRSTAVAGLR